MECQVAISRICAILNELLIKIKKLIEDNDELLNNIEDKFKTEYDAVWNFINMLNHLNYLVEIRLRTSSTVERERASNLASALVNEKKAQVEIESKLMEIDILSRITNSSLYIYVYRDYLYINTKFVYDIIICLYIYLYVCLLFICLFVQCSSDQ